ncbi:MAG TPA: M14 family metallopeptidase [Thermoanaerobaculia bacterium]|nr:M14 family metallopeptidase [Thermoanaerobaculia bacterium]
MPDRVRCTLIPLALFLVLSLLPWTAAAQAPPRDPDDDESPATAAPAAPLSHEEREAIEKLATRAETSHFEATSSYEETLAWLRQLQSHFPAMYLGFYGTSGQGRAMPYVVVSAEKAFTGRRAQRLAKPIVLIQNGIHAGEIDGKDASLLLLRDLALGRYPEVLEKVTLVIVPIYNVDGHERVSPYNRPNQDGPRQGMGFRATANGLDLNRDYLKLSSEEARALIALVNAWRPHLHVDDHVTDGVDMEWVLTYTWAELPQAPPPIDGWLRAHMPAVLAATAKAGYKNGPYVDLEDRNDPAKGFNSWVGQPRYSTGYFPLRNRPSVLVEMHSYKPYEQRVVANRAFLAALLEEIARDPTSLTKAVADAEAATVALGKPDAPPSLVAVDIEANEQADKILFPVYTGETKTSVVSGKPLLLFHRGEVKEIEVPWIHAPKVVKSTPRPRGYLLLPGWPQIEARLRGHGLRVEKLTQPAEVEVEALRVSDPKYAPAPYQGLTRVTPKVERAAERRKVPAGALWIPADQPDFEVAVQLLEPESPDSLLAWGLLSTVFEGKEYVDPRVLEGLVAEMIKDPKTAADWQAALQDTKFAADANARYQWWFHRTPYWDATIGLLPYYRVMKVQKLATQAWR